MQSRVHPLSSAQAIEVPHKMAATIRRIARKKMQSDVSSSGWKRHLEHLYRDGWHI